MCRNGTKLENSNKFYHSCSPQLEIVHDSKKLQLEITSLAIVKNKTFNTILLYIYIFRFLNYIDWTIVQNSFNLLCGFPIS